MDEMPPAAPPTWVLLRGLTREAAHWGCFADDFASAWPGSTVITLDLPGNGQCHRQASPASVAGMVAAARAELVRRGVAPPYHLLALSLGAMVATEWARVVPDEVQGSVLINTSLRPFSPFYRRLRPRNYAALLRMVLQPATANQREQAVLRLTSQRADEHQAVVPAWAAVRAARPVSTANALRQLMAAARYRAPWQAPAPCLLLASAHDGLVHSDCSRAMARAWQAPLVLHPWAGHDLPLDDGAWVIGEVARWMAGKATMAAPTA